MTTAATIKVSLLITLTGCSLHRDDGCRSTNWWFATPLLLIDNYLSHSCVFVNIFFSNHTFFWGIGRALPYFHDKTHCKVSIAVTGVSITHIGYHLLRTRLAATAADHQTNYPSIIIVFFSGTCGASFLGICRLRTPCLKPALMSSSVRFSPT